MKSILITTTALVAFAGAAAADGHAANDGVSFSGEASAKINSLTGYATVAKTTATMTKALDNGLTATAEATIDAVAGTVSAGSISVAGENSELTFGKKLDGAAFTALGDDYAVGKTAAKGGFANGGEEGVAEGFTGMVKFGETSVYVSAPIATAATKINTKEIQVGVKSAVAGWDVALGLTGASDYAATASGTVAGADLNFGYASNKEWDAGVEYGVGPVTLSASSDETQNWKVGADYAAGDYTAGFEYKKDKTWKISGGYAANGIAVDVSQTDASVTTIGATYDLGNGMTAGAGVVNKDSYAFVDFDLGGGASAYVDYTKAAAKLAEVGPSERDIAAGTTVGVSFEF